MGIDYDKLKKLQTVLAQQFVIEDRIREIPKVLNDKQAVLQKTKMDYLEMHNKCEQIKADVESLWQRYTAKGKEREAKEKQIEITTLSRECENLLKEIEDAKTDEQSLLKNYNAKQKYLAELEVKLQISADMVESQEEEVREETAKKDALIAEQEELLKGKISERDELSTGLPQNLLFKFERIIRNKGGVGVVPVHGIICQGCHMELPQQFANDVRKNTDINFCPYCSRILYYEESEEDRKVEELVHGDVHTEDEENGSTEEFISEDENLFDD
ncbi:MAG: C4-type zinc ribbon domain-containing protein [Sphaerochaetaceae bacterium]|nr:C4-type zinc ribbon domain-containing protein [Sphaerochaetaceae bacterium]